MYNRGIKSGETQMASVYGKKGGTSATAGKKMTAYIVSLPDGTTARKRSAFVHTAEAKAGVYEHKGVWYVACIRQPGDGCDHYRSAPAIAACVGQHEA